MIVFSPGHANIKRWKISSMPFLQRSPGRFSSASSRCADGPSNVQADGGSLTHLRIKGQEWEKMKVVALKMLLDYCPYKFAWHS